MEYQLTGVDVTEQKGIENRLEKSFRALSLSFRGTVHAMSRMMESRDPYTAGHQQRVALLALAIGRELGLAKHSLQTLYYGGLLHDVGKVQIPSEILIKPGQISDLEMDIIRGHAAHGGELLGAVEFPWPLARVACEHHERLDGSGYPRGLKGGEVLLESRIVAVADVVEAMSSDRPYRAAMGRERALEAIRQGSGTLYDTEAVQACLRLFEERRFSFEDVLESIDDELCLLSNDHFPSRD